MLYENPKLIGSKIIDCVPLPGPCPNNCPDCYYNRPGAFYAPLDVPILPTLEEAEGKVVRINSGGDSNVWKDEIILITRGYEDKFYNTSIPDMDFPAPVVFTCNGRDIDGNFHKLDDVSNVMFVRVKFNSWNGGLVEEAVRYYTMKEVPVVLTDMRYYTDSLVKKPEDYEWRVHVKNPYWAIKHDIWREIWNRYRKNSLVFSCGSPRSSLCRDCHNCYTLYRAKKAGYSLGTLRFIKAVQSINFDPILADGKNVFLICPVRKITQKQEDFIKRYISKLKEEGKSVHWPPVDTNQTASEWEICLQNAKAILACSEVHIFWNPDSSGSKFDLGMVFMLNLIRSITGTRARVTIVNPQDLKVQVAAKSFEGLLANWKHEVVDWDE